jgi:hypothetical protein
MRLLALALLVPALAAPRTVAVVPHGVEGVAQDGPWIAWLDGYQQLSIRRFDGGRVRRYSSDAEKTYLPRPVALAGSHALWEATNSGNDSYQDVDEATWGDRRGGFLEEAEFSNGYDDGDHLGALAGDGQTLVYSIVTQGVADCEDFSDPCIPTIEGGGLRRVGLVPRNRRVPVTNLRGVPPTWQLAASGRRIALVPLTRGARVDAGVRTVEVRDAVTGALVSGFTAGGDVRAIALTRSLVFALSQSQLEWHDAADGRLVGSLPVPAATAPDLSASGRRVLLHVGRIVQLLDTSTRTISVVTTAAAPSVSPSLEGSRVLWAEHAAGGDVLRMLHL